MPNFFSMDSTYQFEPLVKPVDPVVVEKDLHNLRFKILESIREVTTQKDFSRSELALVARVPQPLSGKILRGNIEKVSTDRLLRIARRLGLRARLRLNMEVENK